MRAKVSPPHRALHSLYLSAEESSHVNPAGIEPLLSPPLLALLELSNSNPILRPLDTQSVRSLAREIARNAYENASLRDPAASWQVTRMRCVYFTPAAPSPSTADSEVHLVVSAADAAGRNFPL